MAGGTTQGETEIKAGGKCSHTATDCVPLSIIEGNIARYLKLS